RHVVDAQDRRLNLVILEVLQVDTEFSAVLHGQVAPNLCQAGIERVIELMLAFVSEVVSIQRAVRADRNDVGQNTGPIGSYGGYGGRLAVREWISLRSPYLRLGVDMGHSITHVEHRGWAEDNRVPDGAVRVLIDDIAHVRLRYPGSVCV